MDLQKLHDNLIQHFKERNGQPRFSYGDPRNRKFGYEIHHIIPRSLGGSDDPDNLVYVKPKEHFTIHHILAKLGSLQMKRAYFTFFCNGNKYKKTSRQYQTAKILIQESTPKNIEQLYRRYFRSSVDKLQKRGLSIMDAEDIVHDAFIKMLKYWDKNKYPPSLMLNTIIGQKRIDFLKEKEEINLIQLEDDVLIQDNSSEQYQLKELIRIAYESLTKTEFPLFIKFYIIGNSVEEIREHRTIGATLNLLFRARNKMSIKYR